MKFTIYFYSVCLCTANGALMELGRRYVFLWIFKNVSLSFAWPRSLRHWRQILRYAGPICVPTPSMPLTHVGSFRVDDKHYSPPRLAYYDRTYTNKPKTHCFRQTRPHPHRLIRRAITLSCNSNEFACISLCSTGRLFEYATNAGSFLLPSINHESFETP